ncbi:hypothetical protein CB577_25185 [Salmonella enterica subsp. enterica serovar Enteritidis]|nr:hypothetical protein [Salmonella enterica subsp. enterica serovar Enteritidis]
MQECDSTTSWYTKKIPQKMLLLLVNFFSKKFMVVKSIHTPLLIIQVTENHLSYKMLCLLYQILIKHK